MLFMVKIVVRLPGDGPKEKLDALVQAETARGMQCVKEGKLNIKHSTTEAWEAAHGAMPPF